MYTIKLINTIIHDERTVFVGNPILNRKLNKAGTLTFTIYDDNPGYNLVLPRMSLVYVYRQGTKPENILWSGVVLTYNINTYGGKEVTCEGTMALLNDVSCSVEPYGTDEHNLDGYLRHSLVTYHNRAIAGDSSRRLAIYFPEQDYVGKMHLYASYAYTTDSSGNAITLFCELLSNSGLTAKELSNKTVYLPEEARRDLIVSFEPGNTGKTSQSIRIGNAYSTQHAASPYFTGKKITLKGDHDTIKPFETVEISHIDPDCFQLLYQGAARSISIIHVNAPNSGSATVLAESFKDSYCSTMEKLNKILDRFGGYFKAYATDYEGIIIEYNESFSKLCDQKITLGDNLEEYMENVDVDIYNKITPFGKNKGTSFLWDYVTIKSVNGGCSFITDEESARTYGQIEKVVHYNDVEDPSELLRLAKIELENSLNFNISVSVKATDKSLEDVNTQAFDIGLLTEIVIPPLGITRRLVCTSITNYLSEPEKDNYTFGSIPKTSSSYVASRGAGTLGGSAGADIEVISNNGGYCLKFPNGWAIATIWKSVSFKTPMAWGSLWYGDCGKPLGALPITFKNIIYRNITIDDGGSFWPLWNPGNESNWSGTIFPIGAAKQTTAVSLIFRGVCIGTWK